MIKEGVNGQEHKDRDDMVLTECLTVNFSLWADWNFFEFA